jgi:spermidine synthase
MGGMFLGSLFLPRFVPPSKHPLRVYAAMEAGIAGLGLLLLVAIPGVSGMYGTLVPPGLPSIIMRAVLCALLLLPPTILMGATLPAMARYVEATPRGVSWMGFFYGGNIAGAVLGCLLAGYYLLRVFDLPTATGVAVGLNLLVAGAALAVSRVSPHQPRLEEGAQEGPLFTAGRKAVYIGIGLSGLTALGAEVVWTRLLSLLLGATTYTFSIILAVFLAALGVGSGVGSYLARVVPNPRTALGLCQALASLGIAWTAYLISSALPYWPINPSITSSPWFLVYAANTVGAIVGGLGFSLIAIPYLGTQDAQRLLILLAIVSAGVLLASALTAKGPRPIGRFGRWVMTVGSVAVAALLISRLASVPPVMVAYGRYAPTYLPPKALFVGEGINSSIAVTELENGDRNIHVGGKVVASTEPQDMRLQRILGHMTALLTEEPRTVLVVGFGAGVTAGTFVTHPSIERIVIVEIEPLVTDVAAGFFSQHNHDVLRDPRVELIHDDGRHFLLTTDETFDLITADPIHPWMKGAAALYTQEYFELAAKHLNPGGVITQWVPLYETTEEVVKSELATFFQVFPRGVVWGNTKEGLGYDLVLSSTNGPRTIDIDALVARIDRFDHGPVAQSLSEVGFPSALGLLTTYSGTAQDLAPWLAGSEINRDRNLRLMFQAGLHLNRYQQSSIYREILDRSRFPSDLFSGSPPNIILLRAFLGLE